MRLGIILKIEIRENKEFYALLYFRKNYEIIFCFSFLMYVYLVKVYENNYVFFLYRYEFLEGFVDVVAKARRFFFTVCSFVGFFSLVREAI